MSHTPPTSRVGTHFGPYYLKRLQSAIADAKEYGLVRRTFEPKDWLDTRFLDKALKEQGLEARWKDLRTPALSRLE